MLPALIYLVAICAIAAVCYWAIDKLGTPEPINRIVKVALVILAVVLIAVLFIRLFGLDVDPPLLAVPKT